MGQLPAQGPAPASLLQLELGTRLGWGLGVDGRTEHADRHGYRDRPVMETLTVTNIRTWSHTSRHTNDEATNGHRVRDIPTKGPLRVIWGRAHSMPHLNLDALHP